MGKSRQPGVCVCAHACRVGGRPMPYTNSSLVRLMKMFISSSCIMRKTALM